MDAKLKGILFADICKFSALIQEDETGTLDALIDLRNEIVLPLVKSHGGTIANRAGDGVLAIFETANGAVSCAEAIISRTISHAPQFRWRIGVHLADIFYEDDTVHGHGVNVTSRIEAYAEPNSIVLTRPVIEALADPSARDIRKIGYRKLKNISPPVLLYGLGPAAPKKPFVTGGRFALGFVAVLMMVSAAVLLGQRTASVTDPPTEIQPPAALVATIGMPSVAVLPFRPLGGTQASGFEKAIASEIITDLTRFTGLKVYALSTMQRFSDSDLDEIRLGVGAQYVVSGTTQREGEKIRVGVEIAETATSRVLWAKRLEAPLENAFDMQLEIAKNVVAVVGPVDKGTGLLGTREWQRVARTKPNDMGAFDHFLLGRKAEERGDLRTARAAYGRALELDPNYGRANARLAWTYAGPYWLGEASKDVLTLARNASAKAMELSAHDNEVLRIHGAIQLLSGNHDAGIKALGEAADLNPGDADTLMWYGWGLSFVGRSGEALAHMTAAYRRNPFPPNWYDWELAWASFMAGAPETTVRLLKPKAKRSPYDHLLLAAAQAQLGLIEEMEATSEAFRRDYPGMGWAPMAAAQPFKRARDRDALETALKLTSIRQIPCN